MSLQSSLLPPAITLRAYAPTTDLTMSTLPAGNTRSGPAMRASAGNPRTEPAPVRFVIIALAVTFLSVFVVLPGLRTGSRDACIIRVGTVAGAIST